MAITLLPGMPLYWASNTIFDTNGIPLALGHIKTYEAGSTTPLATYSDALLTTANPTTIDLDGSGRPTVDVFLAATGYKLEILNASDVVVQTFDMFSNPGQVAIVNFGVLLFQGAKNVTSGYTIVAGFNGDWTVTVDGTGGPNPCVINLCSASTYRNFLTLMNQGNVPISLVPDGSDTIQGIAGAVTIPASAGAGLYPSANFISDSISAWLAIGQSLILT